jgi:hypothetical protein
MQVPCQTRIAVNKGIDTRDFVKLAGLGRVMFASGWAYTADEVPVPGNQYDDFFFVQVVGGA